MNFTNSNFEQDFNQSVNQDNLMDANRVLMQELGNILIKHRTDFTYLLNESGVKADDSMSDPELVNLFIDNVGSNKSLKIGSALLVSHHNQVSGFDGDTEINDKTTKDAYSVLFSYFDAIEEQQSDFVGLGALAGTLMKKAGGGGGGSGEVASKGIDFGKKIYDDKRRQTHGAQDEYFRQQEAKRQMLSAIAEQRKLQLENEQKQIQEKAKTTKTIIIVGSVVVGLALIGGIIYFVRKK